MKVKVLGMRFRFTTVAALGIGFLLGSKTGTGPWDQFMAKVSELQGRADGSTGGRAAGNGVASSVASSTEADVREATVPFTEI